MRSPMRRRPVAGIADASGDCGSDGSSVADPEIAAAAGPRDAPERLDLVRQAGELALDVPIPPEAADRVLPPAAHRLMRLAVSLVAGRDPRLEVAVLGLDDFVVVIAMVLDVAGAAEEDVPVAVELRGGGPVIS